MKTNIHPVWYPEAKVTCACGSTFTTGSTLEQIRVDICSACHPFYTGQQKFVDTMGTVERFQKKTEEAKIKQVEVARVKAAKKARIEDRKKDRPSLKDLLMQARKQVAS